MSSFRMLFFGKTSASLGFHDKSKLGDDRNHSNNEVN